MFYDIPVLLICFKRYDKTLKIVNSIRQIKPQKLYVSIDAHRNQDEAKEVEKVSSIFQTMIDWDCDLKVRRCDINQGCKLGVYNAINWFFDNEEMGIILEDDVVPYEIFYPYCKELLTKYKEDKRVACISGWSYFYKTQPQNYEYTYYFSRIQSSWGWATWGDRWRLIDLDMKNTNWESIEKNLSDDKLSLPIIRYYEWIYKKRISFDSTWDYQFLFSVLMKNNMYCIQPLKRLVSNIGGMDGTHPTNDDHNKSEKFDDGFTLRHPPFFEYIPELDIERNNQTGEFLRL